MTWKTLRVALLISIVALVSEVAAAGPGTDDASKITALLDRWQVVEASKGGDVAVWRDMMGIQLKMVSPSTLDKLLALNTGDDPQSAVQLYQNFIYTLGTDIALRLQAKKAQENAQAQAGAKVENKSLGNFGIDQTFVPITPCRVVDTRNVGGVIGPFATRNFFYYTVSGSWNWGTSQGGVSGAASTVCPGTFFNYAPSAAVATVIVTGQGGAGNLIVWQGTSPVAAADTISYPASGDTSTLADIPWGGRSGAGPGGGILDFGVFVNAFTSTNVVVDIVGYYTQPGKTALDCTIASSAVTLAAVDVWTAIDATCPAGYIATGGGFNTPEGTLGYPGVWTTQLPVSSTTWRTWVDNQTSGSRNIQTFAQCCRVPGH